MPASPSPAAPRFLPAVERLDDRITPSAATARVSLTAAGGQATQTSDSPAMSGDGRFVAFETTARLVATDTNESSDIYLTDRATGSVSLVSADAAGNAAGNSSTAAISGDGRVVAFHSSSPTLATGFGGSVTNVFARDIAAGTTAVVSRNAANAQANESSFRPSLSGDGRFVAFESIASDLVPNFGGRRFGVFVYDRTANATVAVSRNGAGTGPNADAFNADISADGRYVAFQSAASDIVTLFGGGGRTDVFVYDSTAGTTVVASLDATGGAADGGSFAPSISDDGRRVAFESSATDLVAGFGGATSDVFVRDLIGGTTAVASRNAAGTQANQQSDSPTISGNGRYVAFLSSASNTVAGFGGANLRTAFIWDSQGSPTVAATRDAAGGAPDAPVTAPVALSRDGRLLAFTSAATDLLPTGADTNGVADVFVADRPIRAGFAVGAGAGGGPVVRLYNPDGTERFAVLAYPAGYTGGVFVATGDVTGDGVDDVATSTGPGGSANIRVFDGKTGALVRSFFGYPPAFVGGVNVALGDVNDDGFADIVCGVGVGGGPNVRVFSGKDGVLLASFFAYPSSFLGGVRVASADLTGDGFADIICGVGSGGGPNVRVYDGRTGALLSSFFAYAPAFVGGLFLSTGDVNGDGVPDILTGVEGGGGPNVKAFDWRTAATLRSFYAFDATQPSGVRVAAADVDGDGVDDFVTGTGVGPASLVRVFGGRDGATRLRPDFAPFGTFRGGVNVG